MPAISREKQTTQPHQKTKNIKNNEKKPAPELDDQIRKSDEDTRKLQRINYINNYIYIYIYI